MYTNYIKNEKKKSGIEQAFYLFSEACNKDPNNSGAFFHRGKCYMAMQDYKRALYDFSAAIRAESRPGHEKESHKNLSDYYMFAGQCN